MFMICKPHMKIKESIHCLLFGQVYEFRRIFCLRGDTDADKITFTHRKRWGYGGMVDAEDLKSFGYCNRVGSSPTIPTKIWLLRIRVHGFGCVAQLVRALRSHRRGRWFESNHIHQNKTSRHGAFLPCVMLDENQLVRNEAALSAQ